MITVIDYGMGNLRSVVKAVEKYTDKVRISDSPESISGSRALIMPGDGAFGKAMENLCRGGWIEPIKRFISEGGYFLGICLGFQLLFSTSEEFGHTAGLDIIPGRVIRFSGQGLKVPHMGWNNVSFTGSNPFLAGVPEDTHFYFIHSYFPVDVSDDWKIGSVEYGTRFSCIVGRNNVLATQFHPEKSHHAGLRIIENFVRKAC